MPRRPGETASQRSTTQSLSFPDVSDLSIPDAALAIAAAGFPVFPCEARRQDDRFQKVPHSMLRDEEAERGEGGWKLATTNPQKVSEWWARDPEALIGVPPGMAGAVVIDADGPEGVKGLWDEADDDFDLSSTLTVKTPGKGGGLHVWFDRRHTDAIITNGSLQGVKGEARGDRGYVIVPPSKMPDGSKYETSSHTNDLSELPDWAAFILPWDRKGDKERASIADVTTGDEIEWLLRFKPFGGNTKEAEALVQAAEDAVRTAPEGDQEDGRHPTAVREIARILSIAQQGDIEIDLIDAIERVRAALTDVKPKGGPDYDRFVSDAVALRVAETKQKERSYLDLDHDLNLPVLTEQETEAHETARTLEQAGIDPGTEWGTVADIRPRSTSTAADFPLDALPRPIRDAVREVAKATQVAETLPAIAALGALSAATAGGFVLSMGTNWSEGLSLYLIGVADPSERKTAALKPFADAFRASAREWEARTEGERALHAAKQKALETAVKQAEKNIADEGGVDVLAAAMLALDTHVADGDHLVVPNSIVHADPTQEALIHAMSQQHGVGFIASSEGAFIANLAGRYSSSGTGTPDLSLVNEAYSRSLIRSTRVTRGDTVVPVPHLAIVSFIQPSVSERLAVDAFESTGFLSRVLYAHPESKVGEREAKVSRFSPLYSVALDAFSDLLTTVFVKGWTREEEPTVLRLTSDAIAPYEAFWHETEALSPTNPWWGKAHGNAARLAALLALADDPGTEVVDAEHVIAAIRVTRYFADEMMRMRDDVLLGERVISGATSPRLLERLLRAIAKRWDDVAGKPISVRDVQRWLTVGRDEASATAEALTERGWLRAGEDSGRVDRVLYLAHPAIPAYVEAEFDLAQLSELSELSDADTPRKSQNEGATVRTVRGPYTVWGPSSSSSSSINVDTQGGPKTSDTSDSWGEAGEDAEDAPSAEEKPTPTKPGATTLRDALSRAAEDAAADPHVAEQAERIGITFGDPGTEEVTPVTGRKGGAKRCRDCGVLIPLSSLDAEGRRVCDNCGTVAE